jgi:hypothetical protein
VSLANGDHALPSEDRKPRTGHWVAADAPEGMLAALTAFLAPYRHGAARRMLPRLTR